MTGTPFSIFVSEVPLMYVYACRRLHTENSGDQLI